MIDVWATGTETPIPLKAIVGTPLDAAFEVFDFSASSAVPTWEWDPTRRRNLRGRQRRRTQILLRAEELTESVDDAVEPPPHSWLAAALDEVHERLGVDYDTIAAGSGVSRRTLMYWRSAAVEPRPLSLAGFSRLRALCLAGWRRYGTRFAEWVHAGDPSPRALLESGNLDEFERRLLGEPTAIMQFVPRADAGPNADFDLPPTLTSQAPTRRARARRRPA